MRFAGSTILSGGGVRALPFCRMEIVACLWIVCALGTLAMSNQQNTFYTHGRYGKRQESYAQPSAFFSGSRYGRSDRTNSRQSKSEDSKILEVSPRVDRFFLGSRYGKRGGTSNENVNFEILQVRSPRKISLLKRYEEALGYFDRIESRTERFVRTIDDQYDDRNSRDEIDGSSDGDAAKSMQITDEYKLNNIW